jgi:hypothetical protein
MSDDHEGLPASISGASLRQIIKRAQELDGDLADRIPVSEVHEIGRELGLSDPAVTAAINEALSEGTAAQAISSPPPPTLDPQPGFPGYRVAMSGGLGALFGLTGGILSTLGLSYLPTDVGVVGPLAMSVAMAITALRTRGPHGHRDFQIANAFGWLTFGVTFCLALLPPFSLYRAVDLFWSLGTISAAGGAVLIAIRNLWRSRSNIGPRIRGWIRSRFSRNPASAEPAEAHTDRPVLRLVVRA